ncbi:hypothetical protein TIFTF001_053621 [Ficus carica]|uniref:Uncharacterized protein n=1 Tax=Ficus carica TaxID=3494 RepID=A0AA88JI33_FICCA|nr:hypothetical protein TIFTF001_053621 [Ficus carica]
MACAGGRWTRAGWAGVCGRAGAGLAVLAGAGRALVGRALIFRTGLTGPGKAGPIRTEFFGSAGPDKIFPARHERLGRSCRFGTPKRPGQAGSDHPVRASEQKLLAGFPDRLDRERVRSVRTTRSEPESKKCSLVFRTGMTGTSQAGSEQQVRPDRDRSSRSGPAASKNCSLVFRTGLTMTGQAGPDQLVCASELKLLAGFLDRPDQDRSGRSESVLVMRAGAGLALVGRAGAGHALMRNATAGRSLAVRVGAGCADEGPYRIFRTGLTCPG